jgi:hypothetical protein
MTDSRHIAAILGGMIVPLLALGVALHSTVVLIPVIALALVALFLAGRAFGRESTDRHSPQR